MLRNKKLLTFATVVMVVTSSVAALAQTQTDPQKARPRSASSTDKTQKTQKPVPTDRLEPDEPTRKPSDVSEDIQANRQEQMSEEAAVVPYYNNFFSTYRLGPE